MPNELNYATKEASQRLVDAGIVLETEAGWISDVTKDGIVHDLLDINSINGAYYPAPSMAEIRRELPEYKELARLILKKYEYETGDFSIVMLMLELFENTDALIDLLIWVRGQ